MDLPAREPAWNRRARQARQDARLVARLVNHIMMLHQHHGSSLPKFVQIMVGSSPTLSKPLTQEQPEKKTESKVQPSNSTSTYCPPSSEPCPVSDHYAVDPASANSNLRATAREFILSHSLLTPLSFNSHTGGCEREGRVPVTPRAGAVTLEPKHPEESESTADEEYSQAQQQQQNQVQNSRCSSISDCRANATAPTPTSRAEAVETNRAQILLNLRDLQGGAVQFKMKQTTPFRKLLDVYCTRFNVRESEMIFTVNGRQLLPADNARQLGLEDGCHVKVALAADANETSQQQDLAADCTDDGGNN